MSLSKDTVTVITGASSGIGSATAHRLAQSGGRIILASRSEDKLKKLLRRLMQRATMLSTA